MVIGIGGVSRAGKSTLADQLARQADPRGRRSVILHQDIYVREKAQLPRIRDRVDWEHPESIDWSRLRTAILQAQARHEWIFVEGLFAFSRSEINALYDKALFLHIPETVFRQRKLVDDRWGKEPDWYLDHIWLAHQRFGRPPSGLSPLVHISGEVMVAPEIRSALLR